MVLAASMLDDGGATGQVALMADDPENYMAQALKCAEAAAVAGEVPVGAVLVDSASGAVLAVDHNHVEANGDPTAHAEMQVIRKAVAQHGKKWLAECDLYVTLEPCPMCAAAISLARIRRLVFGAYDPKSGGVEHGPRIFEQATCHHKPDVIGGVNETESGALLKYFFQAKR